MKFTKMLQLIAFTLLACMATSLDSAGIKNIALVHGAWADGSGWKEVSDILTKDGYNVTVV